MHIAYINITIVFFLYVRDMVFFLNIKIRVTLIKENSIISNMNVYVRDDVVEMLKSISLRKKIYGIDDEKILQKIPISDVLDAMIHDCLGVENE